MPLINNASKILTHGFDLCPLSEVILYSCRLSGPAALSVVRSIEDVRISEVKNTLYYGKSNRYHEMSPLYGGCPLLGESVMGGFTVLILCKFDCSTRNPTIILIWEHMKQDGPEVKF